MKRIMIFLFLALLVALGIRFGFHLLEGIIDTATAMFEASLPKF